MKKLRVMVDFYQHEQTALEELCQADYRLPDDQIRWLVTTEAKRRGILSANANSDVNIRQDSHVAVVA
jgi:hypothetical protein